jgi:hypothetical protein
MFTECSLNVLSTVILHTVVAQAMLVNAVQRLAEDSGTANGADVDIQRTILVTERLSSSG